MNDLELRLLGEMLSLVTHQISQPLGVIRSATSSARRDIEDNLFKVEEVKPLLDKIWKQTDCLHEILTTFKRLAKKDSLLKEPVNLNTVIHQTLELFTEQFIQCKINVVTQLADADLVVYANAQLIQEVLVNLLTNARDALKDQNFAAIRIASWQQGSTAHFQVRDNGSGIPDTIRQHLFVPLHSTKPQGTGFGLYICRKLITEFNGTIEYTDHPEGGGCFNLTLPIINVT